MFGSRPASSAASSVGRSLLHPIQDCSSSSSQRIILRSSKNSHPISSLSLSSSFIRFISTTTNPNHSFQRQSSSKCKSLNSNVFKVC